MNHRQQHNISDQYQVRWLKRTIKELVMGTIPLELQTRRRPRLITFFLSISQCFLIEGFVSDFDHQPLLSPIIGIITHYHHHQWNMKWCSLTLRWRSASRLLGSTPTSWNPTRRRKATKQMWIFAQENALLGDTPILNSRKAKYIIALETFSPRSKNLNPSSKTQRKSSFFLYSQSSWALANTFCYIMTTAKEFKIESLYNKKMVRFGRSESVESSSGHRLVKNQNRLSRPKTPEETESVGMM